MLPLFLRISTVVFIILGYYNVITDKVAIGIFALFVLIFGIPHGSIDHLVSLKTTNLSFKSIPGKFYVEYFKYFLLVVVGWLIAPVISFILFIFLSGYHFGQSQLYDVTQSASVKKLRFLNLCWGTMVISLIFHFHYTEVFGIVNSFLKLSALDSELFRVIVYNILLLSTGCLIFGIIIFFLDGEFKLKRMLFEFLDLTLLILLFKFTPLLVAFGVFFGLWHSLKAMDAEFKVLKSKISNFSLPAFVKSMIPLTAISVAGLMVLIFLGIYFDQSISPIMLFVVGISALTLPHAISMEKMYKKTLSEERA